MVRAGIGWRRSYCSGVPRWTSGYATRRAWRGEGLAPDLPSTLRVLARDAVVIGTGLILRARLGADGCKSGMKRLPILLTITTRLALAFVLGLNATLESQTNWLQRRLKQKSSVKKAPSIVTAADM
jgi:hypothetical protein